MEASANHHYLSDDYTEIYRRLPLKLQLAYGTGHVLNDICASMWFTYLLVYFHLVLEFSNWEAGFLMLVGQVADAIATPFVGYYSDQSDDFWFCRYGRRKIWHLVGTICVICAFPFIFSPCILCQDSHKTAQMFYYSMFIIIFQFGWASVQISHLSLIPELTPNEHDRTRLTAIRYSFTVISNLLVYVITWAVLHLTTGEQSRIGPGDMVKFDNIVYFGVGVGILSSVVFHIFVREDDNNGSSNVRGAQLRTSVCDLLTSLEVHKVAIVYMSTRLFVNLTQVFVPLYLHETLQMTASALALIPLIMFIGSFLTSITLEKMNKWLGRKIAYFFGGLLGCAACLWIYFRSGPAFVNSEIYMVAVLIGIGGSIMLVTSLGITADLIGDKTGSGAFVYGIMSFTDKLANGVAVVVIQDIHNDEQNTMFYRNTIAYVCGGAALLGSLVVLTIFTRGRPSNAEYEPIPGSSSINNDGYLSSEPIQPSLIS